MPGFRFVPEARVELEGAFDFYLTQAGTGVAEAFVLEVNRVANMLALNPRYGKQISDHWRSFGLRRFPYSLIYMARDNGIRIVAVAHQNRKFGYWAGRA